MDIYNLGVALDHAPCVSLTVESSCDNEAKVAAFVGKEQCVNAVVQCHPSFVEISDYEGEDWLIHPGRVYSYHV